MKSIKPGRGPSMMGGLGSIFAGVFGVIWTMAAVQMVAGIFALFGVVFILFAVLQAVYQFKNATGENRYSEFDITEDGEEPDPLEKRMAPPSSPAEENKEPGGGFCPYCGAPAEKDYDFCRRCGKKLP